MGDHVFLPNSSAQYDLVKYILDFSSEENWTIDIVTNGVDLDKYTDLLSKYNISQIQVTIDGPKHVHDQRKKFLNVTGSFNSIVFSVEKALHRGLPVVSRINVDGNNIDYLLDLATFFDGNDWFNYRFGAYLGLTFDFFGQYQYQIKPHEVLEKVLSLRSEHSLMKSLSLEAWEPLQFILYPYFKGEPRLPKFSYCGAQRSEVSLDLNGKVFICADSVGRKEYVMGEYSDSIYLSSKVNDIRNFDVTQTTTACKDCRYQLLCGGGCWFRRNMTKNADCAEYLQPLLHTAIKYLHYHPEVFNRI